MTWEPQGSSAPTGDGALGGGHGHSRVSSARLDCGDPGRLSETPSTPHRGQQDQTLRTVHVHSRPAVLGRLGPPRTRLPAGAPWAAGRAHRVETGSRALWTSGRRIQTLTPLLHVPRPDVRSGSESHWAWGLCCHPERPAAPRASCLGAETGRHKFHPDSLGGTGAPGWQMRGGGHGHSALPGMGKTKATKSPRPRALLFEAGGQACVARTGPWPGGALWISPCLCGNSGREGGAGLSTGHGHRPACFPTQGHSQGSCVAHCGGGGTVSSVGGNSRLGTPPGTRSPWPPQPPQPAPGPTSKSPTKKGPCHPGVPQDRARLRAVFSFLFLRRQARWSGPCSGAWGRRPCGQRLHLSLTSSQTTVLSSPTSAARELGLWGPGFVLPGEAGPSFLHQRRALWRGS